MTPKRTEIERVLIYRLGSLGDNIIALPSYHLVAHAFPKAQRRLLTNFPVHAKAAAAAAVLGGSGLVHGYIHYPVGMRRLREVLTVREEIRRFRPQVLVYLSSMRGPRAAWRDRLFFRICGIRKIIGLPQSREDFTRRQLAVSRDFEPEASRLARSLLELGEVDLEAPANWDLRLNQSELDRAAAISQHRLDGQPFLAVSLGTKAQANDWEQANWTALLARLATALDGYRLVLLGSPDEAAVCDRAAAAWGPRAINLCGTLTPRESAALLQQARLFVGHDSGPMHLASAVGTPCVAIFSARNLPRIWFPSGSGHRVLYHRTDCAGCGLATCIAQQKKCILSITVDEVFSAIREQLDPYVRMQR